MRTAFPRLIAILAVIQLLGGHWIALQSVAWAGMIAKYSRTDSLAGALEKTFDGENACELCHMVEEGREKERELPAMQQTQVRLDAVLTCTVELDTPRSSRREFQRVSLRASMRSGVPPVPPPRAA